MSWSDRPLKCDGCGRVTFRPSCAGSCAPSTLPKEYGEWPCQGALRDETPAEGVERRQRALAAFLERPS